MSIAETGQGMSLAARPLIITGVLLLIVLSMVIPLPAGLLDVGIALSIATATLILVMASLVDKPTDFQAFPVLLLMSLLLRLSLNISSTRLILTHGQNGPSAAGHVIEGFAEQYPGVRIEVIYRRTIPSLRLLTEAGAPKVDIIMSSSPTFFNTLDKAGLPGRDRERFLSSTRKFDRLIRV